MGQRTLRKLPQHCRKCKKVLRKYNKSGFCSICGERTRQEKIRDKKGLIMLSLIAIFTLCFVSFVNAEFFQFDNVKSYDAVKQEVTITNTFGLGEDIAKIKLNTPLNNIVFEGYNKIAEIQIISYKDYSNALEEIKFYNARDLKEDFSRTYEYKVKSYEEIEINDYKELCSKIADKNGTLTETCEQVLIGTHKENKEVWIPLEKADFLSGEVITLGIFTQVRKGDFVEWIPNKWFGINTISEWATWTGVGLFYANSHGLTQTTNQGANPLGHGVTALTRDATILNYIIEKPTAATTTNCSIHYFNKTNIAWGTFSGYNCSIDLTQPLANNTYYWFMTWGGEGKRSTSASFPYVTAYLTINQSTGDYGMNAPYQTTQIQGVKTIWVQLGISKSNASLILNSPVNYFNVSTPSVTFNWTARDYNEGGGIKNVSLSIDGNTEYTNTTGINGTYTYTKVLTSGLHNWSVLAWNNNATYNQSETRFINLTILSPTITLYTPDGVTNYNVTFVRFNTSVTDNLKVQNVSLYIDSVLNETNTSNYNGTYIFDRYLSEGTHTWYVLAYDNESNPSQSSTINFKVDLTSPVITFTYPLNQTYYTPWTNISNLNVTFNWSSYDANIDKCWYSKNSGANTTLTCNTNLTTNTPYGSSVNILSCANDSVNNIGCSSRTASYKYLIYEINQSYNNPVLESTPQNYYANIYLDPSLSVNSVYFTYNGTNYSASYSNIGNYTRLEKTGFYTPSVGANSNNTITWWALLDDSSRINLSTQLQQVNNLILSSICNATYPYYIFNFTLKDERTQLNINGTIETDIRIKTANGTTTLFNWTSSFYNTSSYLCSNNPINSGNNYIADGTIKYYASNENYSAMVEYYNFLNFSYNNNTYYQNISLYDLNVTEGTEFQLTFKDSAFRTRENILIYVYRQYLPEGTFKVVELPKTDSNGQAVIHLVRNDVIYNLIAVDSAGNVLGNLNNVIAFCEDYTIGNCKINFQGITSETDLENYISDLGLSYTLSFDDTTNIISFVFSSITNSVKDIRLEVISSAVVTNRTICNNSLSAITGTITCDVSAIVNSSSNVNVKIFVSNEEVINENLSLDSSDWNVKGIIFFGFLFLLIIGIFFIESKEGLIISVILGFIVLISLGIAKGKIIGFTSGILWLIIVGIILLIKLNKENKQ